MWGGHYLPELEQLILSLTDSAYPMVIEKGARSHYKKSLARRILLRFVLSLGELAVNLN
jgi:hypothetical protein